MKTAKAWVCTNYGAMGDTHKWIVNHCPYCNGTHIHNVPGFDSSAKAYLGERTAPCGNVYILEDEDEGK